MMLRVYLDQAKWIDLARAANGNPLGERFHTVGAVIATAVEQQQASFPLSAGHFIETWKKRRATQRLELASTMATISQNHAIASPHRLLPAELDRALRRRFGRPNAPLPLQPFGWGIRHITGIHNGPPIPEVMRATVLATNPWLDARELANAIDQLLLAGPAQDMPVAGIPLPPIGPAEKFANGENEQVERFIKYGADKDTRRRGVAARELLGIQEPLEAAMRRAGIWWDELFALGAEGITELMLDLPTRAAALELMWRQHDNTQTAWKPNDMNDIGYLSTAVAYCDVVVTERKWTHMLNQSGVARRSGTTVISDLADLIELLVTASAVAA
jgi:hypothetical protein